MRLLLVLAALMLMGAVPARAADVLPDIAQLVPRDLVVKHTKVDGEKRLHLGFSSTATNVGAGPLTLHGRRRSEARKKMAVDQIITQRKGPPRLIRNVGLMQYEVHPDHEHWHFSGFETYELRSADGSRLLGTDRKTGFCLGDRLRAPNARSVPNFTPVPLQGDQCGLGQPGLLSLFAGISPGWADRYAAHIEGQYIDITGLESGRYLVVHWANVLRRIEESRYGNNMSATRFSLTNRRDARRLPRIRVLRRCPASLTCPARS